MAHHPQSCLPMPGRGQPHPIILSTLPHAGKQDPYCVITLGGKTYRSNTNTDGGKNPVWNQLFTFYNVHSGQELKLEVRWCQMIATPKEPKRLAQINARLLLQSTPSHAARCRRRSCMHVCLPVSRCAK